MQNHIEVLDQMTSENRRADESHHVPVVDLGVVAQETENPKEVNLLKTERKISRKNRRKKLRDLVHDQADDDLHHEDVTTIPLDEVVEEEAAAVITPNLELLQFLTYQTELKNTKSSEFLNDTERLRNAN